MMYQFKNYSLIILMLLQTSILAGTTKPSWIDNRPINPNYYIGIGMAFKHDVNDYRKIAKDNALQDLSSEITINISGEWVRKVIDRAGIVQDEFQSQVQSSTIANLEGYELVDTWEDEQQYWIYYRLAKDTYLEKKKERIAKASSLGLDLFKRAKEREKIPDPSAAMLFYAQALNAIEGLITEPLQVDYQGNLVYLQNEIYSTLQSLLNKINLRPVNPEIEGRVGRALKEPLVVMARYENDYLINNLPLRFTFTKGEGVLAGLEKTDAQGQAITSITNIKSNEPIQIVEVKVELSSNTEGLSKITQTILNSLSLPMAKFALHIGGLVFFIEASELHLGQVLELKYIEPRLKNGLAAKGYTFSNDPSQADVLVSLKANSRKGAEVYNLYSAFVDLTISAVNGSNGAELYKNSLTGIKGIQLDYEKASIEALQNAAIKIEELIPELIAKVQ